MDVLGRWPCLLYLFLLYVWWQGYQCANAAECWGGGYEIMAVFVTDTVHCTSVGEGIPYLVYATFLHDVVSCERYLYNIVKLANRHLFLARAMCRSFAPNVLGMPAVGCWG